MYANSGSPDMDKIYVAAEEQIFDAVNSSGHDTPHAR